MYWLYLQLMRKVAPEQYRRETHVQLRHSHFVLWGSLFAFAVFAAWIIAAVVMYG